ncbi:TBC1 domain family member 14 [Trichinella pseudospiralis]|uniref:TBC1 domain family member 14 n=1 Tax=Trichinella pseudospiralis TaxID=6337 RepID=A0A0V1JBC6_TRIPS|nr:TBC1 domain family member 14 [Trichinella pseudospiralis]KRZ32284.1 TBC1 domain family member 14 [Trichinella pseudospiralis]
MNTVNMSAPLCSTSTPVVADCDESGDRLQASCLHSVGAFKDSGLHLDSSESDDMVQVLHSHDQLVCFSLNPKEEFATESVNCSLMPAANRGHVRHWSYDPAAARFLTQEGFCLINTSNTNTAAQLERRNSLGKTTDISSSSISISSLSHSDYSTSLASFSDEAGCSSSNGSTSKHSSLDRRSFCSDTTGNNTTAPIQTDSKDRLKLFSQFLPRNLFLRKNNNTNEGSAWKLFTKLAISNSSTPEAPQVISTTALILEERPSSLPPKSACEQNRQKQEYALMVEKAKKKEQRDLKQRRREMKEQLKREEQLVTFVKEWSQEILPRWNELKSCKRVKDLWGKGLPPCIRGKVWKLAIANELNIFFTFVCIVPKIAGLSIAKNPMTNLRAVVQGMSFIAAILLLNLDLVDAFIAFCNLLNRPALMSFFRLQQDKMERYFTAYDVYFKLALPKLHEHFNNLDISILCMYEDILLQMDFDRSVQFLTHLPDKIQASNLFKRIDQVKASVDKERHIFDSILDD